jgi:hypothetical protein
MSYELGNIQGLGDTESWHNPATGHGGTGRPPADEIRTGNLKRVKLPAFKDRYVWVPPARMTIKRVAPLLIPIAAVGAALAAPLVIPMLAKGAVGAGKLVARGARSIFRKPPMPSDFIGPPAPAGTRGTESLFQQGMDLLKQIPAATGPGISPTPSIPEGPSVQSDAATMQTGGGGGGMSPTTPFMDESAPEAAGAGAPKPGMNPLFILGAALLVGSMAKKSSRRR